MFDRFAMIITPPDYLVDEQWTENNEIMQYIKSMNEKYTPLEASYFLDAYDPNKVKAIIKKLGTKYLSRKDCELLIKTHDRLWDACIIACNIDLIERMHFSNKPLREGVDAEIEERKNAIMALIRKHNAKDLIPLMAFTDNKTN